MWKYSEILMDHFMNPRNAGSIEEPDGHSEVGSPQCGDAMTLDIEVDDSDVITDIKFQTFGCAGAIASASAMTEIAKGRTLDSAMKISNREVAEYLGGMPPEKYHCSVMGHEAMTEAIRDFKEKRDGTAAALEKILAGISGGPEVKVVHIHPSRVLLEIDGDDAPGVCASLSGELQKATGREVEVKVV